MLSTPPTIPKTRKPAEVALLLALPVAVLLHSPVVLPRALCPLLDLPDRPTEATARDPAMVPQVTQLPPVTPLRVRMALVLAQALAQVWVLVLDMANRPTRPADLRKVTPLPRRRMVDMVLLPHRRRIQAHRSTDDLPRDLLVDTLRMDRDLLHPRDTKLNGWG